MKLALSTDPVVKPIDYSIRPLEIIVAVDASDTGWGAVLLQGRDGQRHPARFESGIWNAAQKSYDSGKRECRATLKALKKFRIYVYGIGFTLEVDAATLLAQLNHSAADLPGALITRWLAWIRLFDFDVVHVPGRRHSAPDGLSRRPQATSDHVDTVDIDEEIESNLAAIRVRLFPAGIRAAERILAEEYNDKSECIAQYLCTLKRLHMPAKEWKTFKTEALKFIVDGRHLYRRGDRGCPLRHVIDDEQVRMRLMQGTHDECGHKGREGTYYILKRRA